MIQGYIGNQVISQVNVLDLVNKQQISEIPRIYSAFDKSKVFIKTTIKDPSFVTQSQSVQVNNIQIPIPIIEVSEKYLVELRNKKQNFMLKQKIQF